MERHSFERVGADGGIHGGKDGVMKMGKRCMGSEEHGDFFRLTKNTSGRCAKALKLGCDFRGISILCRIANASTRQTGNWIAYFAKEICGEENPLDASKKRLVAMNC